MRLKPWQWWALLIFLIIMIAKDGHAVGHFIWQLEQGLNGMSQGMNGG